MHSITVSKQYYYKQAQKWRQYIIIHVKLYHEYSHNTKVKMCLKWETEITI